MRTKLSLRRGPSRVRDDFNLRVLRRLAEEVGNRCSNPNCRASTSGPSRERGGSNVGVGAHIAAASPGGPRFDPSMTSDERKSHRNGVWLCGRCARAIDNDVVTYTVAALVRWKQQAIQNAHRDLERGGSALETAAIYEAPGLDKIRCVAFAFNRPGNWDDVMAGFKVIGPYAFEGTPIQRHAVLEAIARLATYVRAPMPDHALFELLGQLRAALPNRDDPRELAAKSLLLGIEAVSHVAYDLTLYCRHGFGIIECTKILEDCLWIADTFTHGPARNMILQELKDLEATAARANPPFEDAIAWFRDHRLNPGRHRVPDELLQVEARLLGIVSLRSDGHD